MAFERRDFAGDAVQATLLGDITSTTTSLSIDNASGWPTGTNGKFFVVIDRAQANEEKILVQSRSGTTLVLASSSDRGQDGTTAAAHLAGAKVEHCVSATDLDEANHAVAQTIAKVTTKGDAIIASAGNTFVRVAVGTNSTVFQADSSQTSGTKWALVNESNVASSIAGNGLAGGGGTPLSVNVDASTIEINADTLRVKDAGITDAKLALVVAHGVVAAPVNSSGVWTITTSEAKHTALADYAFTAVTGRRYAINILADSSSLSAGDAITLKIRDGAASSPTTGSTQLGQSLRWPLFGTGSASRDTRNFIVPVNGLSGGTHTINVFGLLSNGSAADTIQVCELWVEDIGT